MSGTWTEFFAAVEAGIAAAAEGALAGFVVEIKADTQAFLKQAETDLRTWTSELAAGQIDAEDLREYVEADVALAKLAALTAAGIGLADLQRFRDALVDTVVNAAVSTFKI